MPEFTDFSKLGPIPQTIRDNQTPFTQPTPFELAWAQIQQANSIANTALASQARSIEDLIADAKARLAAGGTKAADGTEDLVEAGDKATVKQLHALAEEAKRARDEAGKQYDAIKQVLKDLCGEHDGLTVNGVPIFTNKLSISRIIDQAAFKEQFPDTPENARFYKDSPRRTALLK
jgi:hypothetical protein